MKNKILKISVVILLIMTLTMTNFIFLGSSIISYAADAISTNNKNIEFSAYFKNSNGEAVTSLDRTSDVQDMSMYLSINVKKEGIDVKPEIMIPLVGDYKELVYVKNIITSTADEM